MSILFKVSSCLPILLDTGNRFQVVMKLEFKLQFQSKGWCESLKSWEVCVFPFLRYKGLRMLIEHGLNPDEFLQEMESAIIDCDDSDESSAVSGSSCLTEFG